MRLSVCVGAVDRVETKAFCVSDETRQDIAASKSMERLRSGEEY